MSATAFQDHKIESFFAILDENGDGKLQWDDIQRLADRLLATFDQPADSPKGQAVNESFKTFWDRLLAELDSDGDGEVSPEEYRAGLTALFIDGQEFDPIFRPAIKAVADLCDTDGNGTLGAEEYVAMEGAFGIDAADARHAFSRLDVNGDGQLDVDELVEAARVYYTSDDPDAVGNWLFGRHGL